MRWNKQLTPWAIVAALVFSRSVAQAQNNLDTLAQRCAAMAMKIAGAYPFRVNGTNIINLHPLINYYKAVDRNGTPLMAKRPLPEWELIHGTVSQNSGDGLIVRKFGSLDWEERGDSELIFLANHPSANRLVENDTVCMFAKSTESHTNASAPGGNKVIPGFDCGVMLKGAQLEQAEKDWQQTVRFQQNLQTEINARIAAQNKAKADEQKKKRAAEQDHKAFQFYLNKAQGGDGAAQFRLAELYLAGRGTTASSETARLWLEAAVTNGNSQAEAKLKSLSK